MYNLEPTDNAPGHETYNDGRSPLTGETAVVHIRAWLFTEVAELLSIAPAALDAQEPLSNYGLSSMTGMMLSGDIEDWLGLKLDPAVAWEHPTIEALAHYLSKELKAQQAAR
jgi:acyl carrier protein